MKKIRNLLLITIIVFTVLLLWKSKCEAIDKPEDAIISLSEWTNENVVITLPTIDGLETRYTIDGTEPSINSTKYEGPFEVENNLKVIYVYTDGTEISESNEIDITNIDKLEPKEFTPETEVKTNSIKVMVSAEDEDATQTNGKSEIAGYRFKIDDEEWTDFQVTGEYTFNNFAPNTEHTIAIEAKDNAGNTIQKTITETTQQIPVPNNLTYAPTTWTNGSITITLPTIDGLTTVYTLDGTEPTIDSNLYEEPFEIDANVTIKYAYSDGINIGIPNETIITNIDKLQPKEFIPTIETTLNSIKVIATVEDEDETELNGKSGITQYRFKINDGEWTEYQEGGEYTFSELSQNVEYTIVVEAKDAAGNTREATVTKTIYPIPAIGNATYTPTTWTNGNVTITLPTLEGYTTKYTIDGTEPSIDSAKYEEPFEVSENCTIYYVYSDGTNIGGLGTLMVTNIDKLVPNTFTPNAETTLSTIKINARTTDQSTTQISGNSGIFGYRFKINNGEFSDYQESGIYTFNNLIHDTQYAITIEVKDNAGNIISSSIVVTTNKIDYVTGEKNLISTGKYVLDDGGVGYRATGDATAINKVIQNASKDAVAKGKQALVVIPKGTYNLTERILLRSNVYLLIDNEATINRSKNGNYILIQLEANTKDITLDGGKLNGNSGKQNVVHANGITNLVIQNTTITENNAGQHGIQIVNCKNVNISNNNISKNKDYGLRIQESNVTINSNTISNNTRGIYADNKSTLTLTNNTISNNSEHGITVSGSGTTLNMSSKNTVKNNYKHGIHITDSAVATIDKVTVDSNGINDGYQGSTHGICISNKGILTLTNSTITNNGWNGVAASEQSKVTIHDNYFSGQGAGKIKGKKITTEDDCGHGIGISMASTGNIYNNTIEKNNVCGISVSYRAKVNIYNNTIKQNGRHAIGLTRGAYIDAYSNTIKDNKYDGILISVGSSGNIHDNKEIDNNKVNGISVMDASSATIKNNGIKNNGQNGIGLGAGKEWSEYEPATDQNGYTNEKKKGKAKNIGSSATIEKNTITGNKKHGISVGTISEATISNKNNISNNGDNGIITQDCNTVKINSSNTISNNKNNGIYATGTSTKVEVKSNTINQNGKNGIHINNGATASSIQKNTINKNKNHGISVAKSSKATIKNKNNISNNKKNGIAVQTASNVTIKSSNTINSNSNNGIYVTDKSTKVTIESNTIKSNKERAIYVKNKATAKSIQKNTITDHAKYGIRIEKSTATIKNNSLSNPNAKFEISVDNSKVNVPEMRPVTVNTLKNKAIKIKGTATNGLKVTTKINKKNYSAKVKKLNYTINLSKKLKKGDKVTVKTEDKAKNIASNEVIVK